MSTFQLAEFAAPIIVQTPLSNDFSGRGGERSPWLHRAMSNENGLGDVVSDGNEMRSQLDFACVGEYEFGCRMQQRLKVGWPSAFSPLNMRTASAAVYRE